MVLSVSILVIVALCVLSMPVAFSFLAGSLVYLFMAGIPLGSIASASFYSMDSYALLALPLFLVAGELMERGGIAEKLIDFTSMLLIRVKGGMGAAVPVGCGFFGAISGSGAAAAAALTKIMVPRYEKMGWDRRYIAAFMGASASISFMIPPNMTAIIYAIVSPAGIRALFLSGVIPGILWIVFYLVINRFIYAPYFKPTELHVKMTEQPYFPALKKSIKSTIPAFLMPIVVLGGIYGGVFTPTEAGAVSCVYAIIVSVLVYRKMNLKNLVASFVDSGKTLGAILLLFPFVLVYSRILVRARVPEAITSVLINVTDNPVLLILIMCFIFIVAGMFVTPGVLVLIITPLMMPTANFIGMSPVHLGCLMFIAVGIGTSSPPMAVDLFVVTRVSGVPMQDMIKPLMPFLIFGCLPLMLLVAYVPWLSMWLPQLVLGKDIIGEITWLF